MSVPCLDDVNSHEIIDVNNHDWIIKNVYSYMYVYALNKPHIYTIPLMCVHIHTCLHSGGLVVYFSHMHGAVIDSIHWALKV